MKLITHNIPEEPTAVQINMVEQSLRAVEQVTDMRVKSLRKQISELRAEFASKDTYLHELRADLNKVMELRLSRSLEVVDA